MEPILITHSYFLKLDPKQYSNGQPYPPLGTLYATSLLKSKGYSISFFDPMFSSGPESIIPILSELNPKVLVIYDDGFNYLTKMCLTKMREASFFMIRQAKNLGIRVIVSSSDSTDHYIEYLNEGADFILIGEGEQTLLELIGGIKKEENDFSAIQGIAYKSGDKFIKTKPRLVMKELDSLPFPAWDLLDIKPYKDTWLKSRGFFSINMGTTRGCPFKCNWCAKPIYGNRYNSRSPANVVEEMKWLIKIFKIDHIWFCDDIFGLKPGWIQEFAQILGKENIRIPFKIQSRVDLLNEECQIEDLYKAGCENVWLGAESGSQKILDAMDKGITVEQIFSVSPRLKKIGIKPSFFIQFGYPGEDWEDILLTIKMIKELLPYEIGISVSYPLPGTIFYEKVKTELKKKTNWTDSDELALLFENTFSAQFYKQLYRYVHKNYQMEIARESLIHLINNPFQLSFKRIKKAASFLYYNPTTQMERKKLLKLEKG